ncbi:MAG: hypothetical protein BMS9Abin09_0668 [Gammaproteobacteria bacterium]|nr:MAG: hypothetical protein BMS9Abin09_0668 [Gammaproteobacteria bacterium]
MKMSDKALKLIGRMILGSTDSTKNQNPLEISREKHSPDNTPRFRLNLQAPVKTVKAPVLPFRKKGV